MARSTIRTLVSQVKTYLASAPGIADPTVGLYLSAEGKASNPSFVAQAQFGGQTITVVGDSGKIKRFPTVESAVQAFAKVREANDGIYVPTLDTGALYASKVPANIYTAAASKIVALNKAKAVQEDRRDALLALLAGPMLGWDTGNAAQVEAFNETTAQKDAVVADIATIAAEVITLQAVVDSAP